MINDVFSLNIIYHKFVLIFTIFKCSLYQGILLKIIFLPDLLMKCKACIVKIDALVM